MAVVGAIEAAEEGARRIDFVAWTTPRRGVASTGACSDAPRGVLDVLLLGDDAAEAECSDDDDSDEGVPLSWSVGSRMTTAAADDENGGGTGTADMFAAGLLFFTGRR